NPLAINRIDIQQRKDDVHLHVIEIEGTGVPSEQVSRSFRDDQASIRVRPRSAEFARQRGKCSAGQFGALSFGYLVRSTFIVNDRSILVACGSNIFRNPDRLSILSKRLVLKVAHLLPL